MADLPAVSPAINSSVLINDDKGWGGVIFDTEACSQCIEGFDRLDFTLYGEIVPSTGLVDNLSSPIDGGDVTPSGWRTTLLPVIKPADIIQNDLDNVHQDLFPISGGSIALDEIGERLKFPRAPSEDDDCYRRRIIRFNSKRRDVYDFSNPELMQDGSVRRYNTQLMRLLGTRIPVIQSVLEDLPFIQHAKVRCGEDIVSWTVFERPTAFEDDNVSHPFYFLDRESLKDEELSLWIFGMYAENLLMVVDLWRHAITSWTDSEESIVRTLLDNHFIGACSLYVLRLRTANEGVR